MYNYDNFGSHATLQSNRLEKGRCEVIKKRKEKFKPAEQFNDFTYDIVRF